MNLDIPDDKIAEAILRQLVGDRYGNASLLPAMQVAVKASEAQLASLARDAFAELLADPAFRASVKEAVRAALLSAVEAKARMRIAQRAQASSRDDIPLRRPGDDFNMFDAPLGRCVAAEFALGAVA